MNKLVGILLVFMPALTFACSVAIDYPPELSNASFEDKQHFYWKREFERSDAVFEVLVQSVEELNRTEWPLSRTRGEVLRVWKSDGNDLSVIESGLGGGDCGVGFAVGHRYLVFADRVHEFWSFLPWRTDPLSTWVYSVVYVGPGRTEKPRVKSFMDADAVMSLLSSLQANGPPRRRN